MELVLNVFRVPLSLASMFTWIIHNRSCEGRRRWIRGFVAVTCLLTVVFPVISMTDDRRFDPFVIEDTLTAKPLAKVAAISGTLANWHHALAAALSFVPDPLGRFWGLVATEGPTLSFTHLIQLPQRAPPLPPQPVGNQRGMTPRLFARTMTFRFGPQGGLHVLSFRL